MNLPPPPAIRYEDSLQVATAAAVRAFRAEHEFDDVVRTSVTSFRRVDNGWYLDLVVTTRYRTFVQRWFVSCVLNGRWTVEICVVKELP